MNPIPVPLYTFTGVSSTAFDESDSRAPEGVRGTLGRQLEDVKSRSGAEAARRDEELRRLKEERADLEGRAKRAADEAAVLTRESEVLVKEKEGLVKEINLRAQELVEARAEGEGKRRLWQQEKEELERQMYLLSKDREEQLAKFRTERNGWSDRLREAKLKTAKDDATVKNKLSAVEAERCAPPRPSSPGELRLESYPGVREMP